MKQIAWVHIIKNFTPASSEKSSKFIPKFTTLKNDQFLVYLEQFLIRVLKAENLFLVFTNQTEKKPVQKDRAIMTLAAEYCCPVISRDTDFVLFGNVSVISLDQLDRNARCHIFEKGKSTMIRKLWIKSISSFVGLSLHFFLNQLRLVASNPIA